MGGSKIFDPHRSILAIGMLRWAFASVCLMPFRSRQLAGSCI